ncbi:MULTISPECIES: NAD(P)H-binding protein [Burkholderia]|uniref:NAD(P)H-binding protein n=1 Tax=Burkholderia TaxID=32008 RepID=UPI001177C91F
MPFIHDHQVTEQWIKASGAEYTILRNGWYWDNNTTRSPTAVQYGSLVSSAGNVEISWASRQDFADAAVAVMTEAGHEGKTYELAGDRACTFMGFGCER